MPTRSKELFRKYGSLILVDCTYQLSNRGWVTITISVIDNFPHTKLLAWALFDEENKETLSDVLKLFKEACGDAIERLQFCVLDKSPTELTALYSVFPLVQFFICVWHATETIKKEVTNLHFSTDIESAIREADVRIHQHQHHYHLFRQFLNTFQCILCSP